MKKYPPKTTLERFFDYNPITGELTWKSLSESDFLTNPAYKQHLKTAGKPVGGLNHYGVAITTFAGKRLRVLRIVWILHTGVDPAFTHGMTVTPKNGNHEDYRWSNLCLRQMGDVRKNTNEKNIKNTDKVSGITRNTLAINEWSAKVGTFNLGYFAKKDDAVAALNRANKCAY